MIKKPTYYSLGLLMAFVIASFICMPSVSYSQETGGKKLQVSEKKAPNKLDNKKIKNAKRRKIKGNRRESKNKVIVINPFKWDWDKVMWFKAKKSDYETKDYNPNKRTKRKTYDNQPNYESTDRDAITNPSKLKKPLIPYDSRIADEGPVLQKKSKPKNLDVKDVGPQVTPTMINLNSPSETLTKAPKKEKRSKVDGNKLYTRRKDRDRKEFENEKLETAAAPDIDPKMDEDKIMFKRKKDDYAKMDQDKLMVAEKPDYRSNKQDENKLFTVDASNKKPKPFDNDKLMTVKVDDGKRKQYDESKLMVSEPANRERKPYDDKKLMTALHGDREREPFDDDKLMTAKPANPERKPFDNDKLMTAKPANPTRKKYDDSKLMTATVKKPKTQDLHDDRLLTVLEKKKPTDEMKETSKDISNFKGEYKKHIYVSSDSHPGTKILAAENTKAPFFARTFQSVSSFFNSIWTDDSQPNYVTRKKRKERRDKNEGQIWDNSVHPSEWKKEEAESGEKN